MPLHATKEGGLHSTSALISGRWCKPRATLSADPPTCRGCSDDTGTAKATAEQLIAKGAKVMAPDTNGLTPLHIAAAQYVLLSQLREIRTIERHSLPLPLPLPLTLPLSRWPGSARRASVDVLELYISTIKKLSPLALNAQVTLALLAVPMRRLRPPWNT
jgi:hypothetical protein